MSNNDENFNNDNKKNEDFDFFDSNNTNKQEEVFDGFGTYVTPNNANSSQNNSNYGQNRQVGQFVYTPSYLKNITPEQATKSSKISLITAIAIGGASLLIFITLIISMFINPVTEADTTIDIDNYAELVISENIDSVFQVCANYNNNESKGTGFIVGEFEGYQLILTNRHVIDICIRSNDNYENFVIINSSNIQIVPYDVKYANNTLVNVTATVVDVSSDYDFALLKLDKKTSYDVVEFETVVPLFGDRIVAIGNPYGNGITSTSGIISNPNAIYMYQLKPYDVLQIDAAINSGNSGGPLFDVNGKVIGIVTWKSIKDDGDELYPEAMAYALKSSEIVVFINNYLEDVGGN